MKISQWKDFSKFVGKKLVTLIRSMPDCFELVAQDSGRMVFAHIGNGQQLEVEYDASDEITNVTRWR